MKNTDHTASAMIISSLGGIMDGYSYAVRGGVFATGQTGNLVLLAHGFVSRDMPLFIRALTPIISFWFGVFAAQFILNHIPARSIKPAIPRSMPAPAGIPAPADVPAPIGTPAPTGTSAPTPAPADATASAGSAAPTGTSVSRSWKTVILFVEFVTLFIIGFIPDDVLDIIPNTMISFLAAMQFCCFKELGGKSTYASVFCTGNMRSCAEQYYKWFASRDTAARKKAFQYSGILLSFFAGAAGVMFLSSFMGIRAVWAGAAIAFSCWLYMLLSPGKPGE